MRACLPRPSSCARAARCAARRAPYSMNGTVSVSVAPICQNPGRAGVCPGMPANCVWPGVSLLPNAPVSVSCGRRSDSIAASASRATAICARALATSARAPSAAATSASTGVCGSAGSGSTAGSANGVSGGAPIRCASDSTRVERVGARGGEVRVAAQRVDLRAQHVDAGRAADALLRARDVEQLLLVRAVALREHDRFALLHRVVERRGDVARELLLARGAGLRANPPPGASPPAPGSAPANRCRG